MVTWDDMLVFQKDGPPKGSVPYLPAYVTVLALLGHDWATKLSIKHYLTIMLHCLEEW